MSGTGIRHPGQDGAAGRGFTLIELLVVIGIIGLLISITLVVGRTVMTGGQKTLTSDTIRILDHSLDAYIHATGDNPPPLAAVDPTQPNVMFPAADARDMVNQSTTGVIPAGHQMINSLGVYLYQASEVPDAKAVLDTLPAKVVTTYNSDGLIVGQPRTMMMVLDGWRKPIRYAHPAFQGTLCDKADSAAPQMKKARGMDEILGPVVSPQTYSIAQVRRNHVQTTANMVQAEDWPDSDGGTSGARPYFYSAGPDGFVGVSFANDPSTGNPIADYNTDNVYTTKPQLPVK